jgi:glycosyltransferase involved in cell wall biosynthesis
MELTEAMNLLEDYPHIRLLVIGSSFYGNDDNENDFAKSLKEKAEPLKDRIIFTGFIPYSDMPNYLSIADIAVIPSVWDDPFPTTVLEAQAMGLPIITTRRGGIPEEVTEDNAILLDTDEHFVDNLAKAILDLYEHPEKRKAMSEVSIKRSQLFSKEHYAREFFKALEKI